MVPSVGFSKPSIRRNKVVFPQPDGPTNDTNFPVSIVRLISFNAITSSLLSPDTKTFDTFSISNVTLSPYQNILSCTFVKI